MTLDLITMFDLFFHHLGGEWVGHFRDISQQGDIPGNANPQQLLVKSSPKEFEGQTRHHAGVPLS